MVINFKNKTSNLSEMRIKGFKIEKHFKKGGIHINPNVYWDIALIVGAVLSIYAATYDFYLFKRINQELTITTTSNVKVETLDKGRLDKVLNFFTVREQKSQEIIYSPSPIVDPSQ
jgi:hypothetical protein